MKNADTSLVDASVLEQVLAVVKQTPAGLFTDIDGTISRIAAVPTDAVITEPARTAMIELAHRMAIVGAVTGRAAGDGAAMLALPELIVVGNHGLEWLHGDERWVHPSAGANRQALQAVLAGVGEAATEAGFGDGVLLEDKELSASIHYRLASDPIAAREAILAAASELAGQHNLRVSEGRFVVELRPAVIVNKGTAITELVRAHGLKSVVFLGDDITDVDAFVAIRTLRDQGEVTSISIGVLSPESHPSVELMADVTVLGVDACIDLLTQLASSLSS